jgi:hypothetical protein
MVLAQKQTGKQCIISPCIYIQLIFNKGAQNTLCSPSTNAAGKTGYPHAKNRN